MLILRLYGTASYTTLPPIRCTIAHGIRSKDGLDGPPDTVTATLKVRRTCATWISYVLLRTYQVNLHSVCSLYPAEVYGMLKVSIFKRWLYNNGKPKLSSMVNCRASMVAKRSVWGPIPAFY